MQAAGIDSICSISRCNNSIVWEVSVMFIPGRRKSRDVDFPLRNDRHPAEKDRAVKEHLDVFDTPSLLLQTGSNETAVVEQLQHSDRTL